MPGRYGQTPIPTPRRSRAIRMTLPTQRIGRAGRELVATKANHREYLKKPVSDVAVLAAGAASVGA
jgi:hypothetical protein